MIKVESNMLVLDSAFTKEDVLAINHFVEIAKEQERERIIKLLEDRKSVYKELMDSAESRGALPTADHWEEMIATLNSYIALIKGEK
jgi:hypothetical protein